MKVLNVCRDDWANFMYENYKALQSVGIECRAVKLNKHVFNYENEAEILSHEEIFSLIEHYDVVQIFHSDVTYLFEAHDKNKKIIVYHTGSTYRSDPDYYNRLFNPRVFATFSDQTEFIGLGAKKLKYIATAIDTKAIHKFGHEIKKEYIIGHFPSNPEVKGTEDILRMLRKVDAPYRLNVSTLKVSHAEQYKRMNSCDIYIELFKPELNGKPYGCYGVTAFEAAAAGKIVVTQNINEKAYRDAYGYCPFVICNTEKDFIMKVENILSLSEIEISTLQTHAYEWAQKHNYQETGKYILKHIL